jgi:hypothetical protein
VKFVLVNGRTPYPQTFCMLRCESIKSGYLRATTTQYRLLRLRVLLALLRIRGAVARGSRGRRIKNSIMSCRHLGCDWRRRSVTLAPKA